MIECRGLEFTDFDPRVRIILYDCYIIFWRRLFPRAPGNVQARLGLYSQKSIYQKRNGMTMMRRYVASRNESLQSIHSLYRPPSPLVSPIFKANGIEHQIRLMWLAFVEILWIVVFDSVDASFLFVLPKDIAWPWILLRCSTLWSKWVSTGPWANLTYHRRATLLAHTWYIFASFIFYFLYIDSTKKQKGTKEILTHRNQYCVSRDLSLVNITGLHLILMLNPEPISTWSQNKHQSFP